MTKRGPKPQHLLLVPALSSDAALPSLLNHRTTQQTVMDAKRHHHTEFEMWGICSGCAVVSGQWSLVAVAVLYFQLSSFKVSMLRCPGVMAAADAAPPGGKTHTLASIPRCLLCVARNGVGGGARRALWGVGTLVRLSAFRFWPHRARAHQLSSMCAPLKVSFWPVRIAGGVCCLLRAMAGGRLR